MAAAIIWKSTMGISRRYAEEVKKQLNADIFEADKVSADKLTRYQTVAQSLFSAECITINGSVRIL